MKRNSKLLRTLSVLAVIALVCLGLALHTGTGTPSAWGIYDIAAICPLGAAEAALASKTVVPPMLIALAIGIALVVLFGRAFCAWGCPIPLLRRIFGLKEPKRKRRASDALDVPAAQRGGAADSRNWVLGGALLSTAVFGFPVFCLICPVGLTFATLIAVWRLFQFNEVALSLLVFPATATKTIENEKDRRMTIMTTTMIPCGAKMPIIALVFGAIAGGNTEATWWIAPLFYFLGVIAIIISGIMLKKTKMFAGPTSPFVMELPSYHMPTVKSILMSTWDRIKGYIVKAGTIIFLSTIVIWLLMNFGDAGEGFGLLDTEMDDYIQYSLMAGLGNGIGWIFAPLGFGDWQATVTSITGLVAKENVVATVGILTSLGDVGEADPTMWAAFAALFAGSVPAILAFCAFNLLCAPCFAAIGTIWREMGTAKWTWFTIGYMTIFAWCVGLMFYQFGGLLTGEIGFNVWTVVAIVVLAGMLFQIFRPMPTFDKKKDKVAGELEAEGSVA